MTRLEWTALVLLLAGALLWGALSGASGDWRASVIGFVGFLLSLVAGFLAGAAWSARAIRGHLPPSTEPLVARAFELVPEDEE